MIERTQQFAHALGSDAYLTLVGEPTETEKIFSLLWDEITAFENRFSRFIPESELSLFNELAGTIVDVSTDMVQLLLTVKAYGEETANLYNPFVLPALQRAGYVGSWPSPERYDPKLNYTDRLQLPTVSDIEIGDGWAKIPTDSAIDFGGIGKGYLLDRLSEILSEHELTNYWLSLGGDILSSGYDLGHTSWSIAVAAADSKKPAVAHIKNNGRKLATATSGITKRKGGTGSHRWHHIIDPSTGKPAATKYLSATVCAPDAVTADVYAKCMLLTKSQDQAAKLSVAGKLNEAYIQTKDGVTITLHDTVGVPE